MIVAQEAMWKFRCTLQWIRNLLGWILLMLVFTSIGWFIVYLTLFPETLGPRLQAIGSADFSSSEEVFQ